MSRKYVIVVPDGAADFPIPAFGNKTIFEAAAKPNLDAVAMTGMQGLSKTVPQSLQPGSDVAMTAVLGYDPAKYYTGRAPIEAVAQGIDVAANDWIFRCNLVTTSNGAMADHSAGHISSEEGKLFIDDLNTTLSSEHVKFYPGVGYRHLLIVRGNDFSAVRTFPPHDHIGKKVTDILPQGTNSEFLRNLIADSVKLFAHHEVNLARKKAGKGEANSIWLWGQGKKAAMEPFRQKYGLNGAAITAVDLVKGLALLIGFDVIPVEGATGYFDTNFAGKGRAAIEALKNHDIVLVHVEATDEAGHAGNADVKKKALEDIDTHIIGPVLSALKHYPEWRILVMPDHPTPVSTKGHVGDAVPFAMAGTGITSSVHLPLSEANAAKTGILFDHGYELMKTFLKK